VIAATLKTLDFTSRRQLIVAKRSAVAGEGMLKHNLGQLSVPGIYMSRCKRGSDGFTAPIGHCLLFKEGQMISHEWRAYLLLFVLLVLVACGGLQSNILGKWKEAGGGVMAFEFFKDGTMIMSGLGREFPATYKLPQSDQVQILLSGDLGGREYLLTNVKVSNGRLSCSLNDQGMTKSLEMIRTAASQNVSAGRTAGGALPWLPLIALGVLALGAIGIFFGFGRVAGIRETAQVGVSTGQWRVQALRSANEQAHLARQRDQAIATLGAQAWAQRVQHPDYADMFAKLSALEEQRFESQQELAALNANTQRETGTLNQIKADHGARIGAVQEKKNAATAQLRQLQAEHQTAGKRLADADKQQQTIGSDLRSMQEKLGGAQASTTSDQADRVALLTGGIVTLQRSSADLAGQLPALQADVARLYEAQQPFAAEVAQHDQQLAELQAEQKAAVDPLNARLTDLQTRVRVANERLSALVGQMTPLTASLGGKVARARPEAPALAGAYGEVDRWIVN